MNTHRDPGRSPASWVQVWIALGLLLLTAGVYATLWLGYQLAGSSTRLPVNPFEALFGLAAGKLPWPGAAGWLALGIILAACAGLGVIVGWLIRRVRGRGSRVDKAAVLMGRGTDIDTLTRKQVQSTAARFGLDSFGLPIGVTVSGGVELYSSWEDMRITLAGPRVGKTTCFVIPEILAAPGAVLVTSNKRDVVDATRDMRATGGRVWVFDPQQICLEEPSWWWNPLSYVTDEVKAAQLAEHFAVGSRDPAARTDAYFDPAGQDLLAGLLLAAALDGRSITQIYTWLTRPDNEAPADIVRQAGFHLTADQLAGAYAAPDKQRGGIFGTAQQMASCLTNRQIAAWVTPNAEDDRPQFDPQQFVRTGRGTLYSLSREGRGSAGPLVTALTVAVVEAAEELAARSAGGRLPTPMVGVLDEAANVCRWRELPNLYSHYGSRGIILDTVLQSWSQGVEVWGEPGMKKLWSASNVKVYAGGISEAGFLEDLSRTIGDYDRVTSSSSSSNTGRSVSRQAHRERILDVAALAALPKGRAVVLASGARPTLIRTRPWMSGAQAEAVRASIAAHEPQGQLVKEHS